MSAAVFITIQPQQLLLVCEKHSQGLKAFLQIKGASDGALFHGLAAQVEIVKKGFSNMNIGEKTWDTLYSMSTITMKNNKSALSVCLVYIVGFLHKAIILAR